MPTLHDWSCLAAYDVLPLAVESAYSRRCATWVNWREGARC
jgi:hypothetical protein